MGEGMHTVGIEIVGTVQYTAGVGHMCMDVLEVGSRNHIQCVVH